MLVMVGDELAQGLLSEGLLVVTGAGVMLATRGELKLKALVEPSLDNLFRLALECGLTLRVSFAGPEEVKWKLYEKRKVVKFGEASTFGDLVDQLRQAMELQSKEFRVKWEALTRSATRSSLRSNALI